MPSNRFPGPPIAAGNSTRAKHIVVALAGAGPLGAGALVALGAPVLAPVLAAAVLTGAGAFEGL
jgi:hypothetical protein